MITPGFFSFFNAQRGLLVAQSALNTVGNNISNVNTPGYSKQRVEITSFYPYTEPDPHGVASRFLQIGQGPIVSAITRARDTLLDSQFRLVNSQLGEDQEVLKSLQQIDSILSEIDGNGVGAAMQKFFDSAQELSLHPESNTARQSYLNNAKDMLFVFQQRATQLQDLQDQLVSTSSTSQLSIEVAQINDKLQSIADINAQILTVSASGGHANDLLDQRDKIVDDLSKLVDITITPLSNDQITVSIAGIDMVRRGILLDTLETAVNPGPAPNTGDVPTLVRTVTGGVVLNNGAGAEITSGQIRGTLDVAGNTGTLNSTRSALEYLDNLLVAVVNEVNALQATGRDKTGALGAANPIFTPAAPVTPPLSIFQYAVNPTVLANTNLVAAAANDGTATGPPAGFAGVGDGRNALLIAQLQEKIITVNPVSGPLNTTFKDYLNNAVSNIAVDTSSYQRRVDTQSKLSSEVELNRQSVSGVNVDEEMVDLVRYQRSFEASSKVINSLNEILQSILNMV